MPLLSQSLIELFCGLVSSSACFLSVLHSFSELKLWLLVTSRPYKPQVLLVKEVELK